MSTKVYDGYKLPNFSSKELIDFCHRLKHLVSTEQKEFYFRAHSKRALQLFDLHYLGELPEYKTSEKLFISNPSNPLSIAWSEITEEVREANNKNQMHDYYFHVHFFPLDNKILAMPRSLNSLYNKIWESFSEVEEYGYWNNTDKPDEISNKEWNQRKKDWTEAFRGSVGWYANETGLKFEVMGDPFLFILQKDQSSYFPNVKKRALSAASLIVQNKAIKEALDKNKDKTKNETNKILSRILFSSELREEKNKLAEELEKKIKKDVSQNEIKDTKIEIKNIPKE